MKSPNKKDIKFSSPITIKLTPPKDPMPVILWYKGREYVFNPDIKEFIRI